MQLFLYSDGMLIVSQKNLQIAIVSNMSLAMSQNIQMVGGKNSVPFKIAPKESMKYLGINLTKYVKVPQAKDYKTLVKEIKGI